MDAIPADLDRLINPPAAVQMGTSGLRQQELYEAACSLGARAGLAGQSRRIREELSRVSDSLDKTYAFGALVMSGGVLPPVISEGHGQVQQDTDREIRFAGTVYQIEEPERLVSTIPTWRDYLYEGLYAEQVGLPQNSLLPKDAAEKVIWQAAISSCYEQGVSQANAIYQLNKNRLNQSIKGMIRYRMLVAKGYVKPPKISVIRRDVEVNGSGQRMTIDDRTYSITNPTEFTGGQK